MSWTNWDDDDEAFTEEELLVIDAIEASYKSSHSSSSPTVRATSSGHGYDFPKNILVPSLLLHDFPSLVAEFIATIGGDVDKRAMQLLKVLETKRDESGRAVVGLDIEWRPSFRKGVLPGKVGIGIDGDSVKLLHDYGVSIKDVEDLSDLANQKIGGNSKKWGLASLTETLVCKKLLKPNGIRLGNWEVHPLSKKQLRYAVTDAYALWHLYQVLKDLPDAVSGS